MAWKLPEKDGWPTDEFTKVVWWNPLGYAGRPRNLPPDQSVGMLRFGKFVDGYWQLEGDGRILTPVEFVLIWLDIPALPKEGTTDATT